jgi:hypothetical protein
MVGTNGLTPPIIEYMIEFHMGIGKVTIAFVLINIIGVPIGKTYGLDHINMEVQQLKFIVLQFQSLSSSASQLLDLLLVKSIEVIIIDG